MSGQFSFFYGGGIKNTSISKSFSIIDWYELIVSNKYWTKIRDLRLIDDKKQRNAKKSQLDYACFSGTFTQRDNESLIEHSGFICIDIDGIESIDLVKIQLGSDPYCHLIFISPTGNGLKVIVKIDPKIDTHLAYFRELQVYFKTKYNIDIDEKCKDVSRACFVSYDPKASLNINSLKFELPKIHVDKSTGELIEKRRDYSKHEYPHKDPLYQLSCVVDRIVSKGIDITQDYDNWMLTAFSLATFGEAGRTFFHDLSKMNPEYIASECDKKFTNALTTSRFNNPSWFFSTAKKLGVDIIVENDASKARKTKAEIRSEAKDLDDKSVVNLYEFHGPNRYELTQDEKVQVTKYGLLFFAGKTYIAKFGDANNDGQTKVTFERVANFLMRPLYLIISKTEPKRLYEIENEHKYIKVVDIPAESMVSVTEFSKFVETSGNFHHTMTKGQFNKLKAYLYDKTKTAEEIRTLGWHPEGFYAFANGIVKDKFYRIDKFGVVNIDGVSGNNNFFLPALSIIYKNERELFDTEKRIVYVDREVSFAEWALLFTKVHGENGMIALIFYLAAVFRDMIYSINKFFPHLFLFGPPGTGKSNTAWSMIYLFGLERKPFNLHSGTQVGFHRTFAQVVNGLAWFDEYSNQIDMKRVQDLKAAYDGSGHVKGEYNAGSTSSKTVTTPINSACVISGQELPTADNALFKRSILCEYFKTEYTQLEASLNSELKRMQELGLSKLTGEVVTHRKHVESTYPEQFEKVRNELKKLLQNQSGIESRIIDNMAIILAIHPVLSEKLQLPFDYNEIRDLIVKRIIRQNSLISSSKETSIFWDTIMYLLSTGHLKTGEDFKIDVRHNLTCFIDKEKKFLQWQDGKELLFLRLTKAHPLYLESLRKQGQKQGMSIDSLRHYLQHSKEFIGAVDSMRFDSGIVTSAYIFDHAILKENGINLHIEQDPIASNEPLPF